MTSGTVAIHARFSKPLPRAAAILMLIAFTVGMRIAAASGAEPTTSSEVEAFFETRVRPVLAENCFSCHGGKKQESGLRLDSRAAMLRGGDDGRAVVVPGDPQASPLVRAIRYDGDPQMPPDGKLPEEAIEALTAWVRMGAPWPGIAVPQESRPPADPSAAVRNSTPHWSFQPVRPPAVPTVRQKDWPHTPVDSFILAKLEERGLSPSAPAPRDVLIRRATYDLTGLPPLAEEVAAFGADPSPDAEAFAKVVDRLLASPRYGERWGRHWLDVSRYADTKEYVRLREERRYLYAYTYRDWVIKSFNDDLPYDQFVTAQLAADLMPEPEPGGGRPLAALGFLTLGRGFTNNAHDIIDDRIDVVTRGLLGLSVGCARCHDHKYDPVPTADYYSLYGVFASCEEPAIPPLVDPAAADGERYRAFQQEFERRRQALERFEQPQHAVLLDSFRARTTDYLLRAVEGRAPMILALPTDPGELRPMIVNRWVDYLESSAGRRDPVFAPWHVLAALTPDEFAGRAPQVLRDLATGASPDGLNLLVLRRLAESPPTSMADVARAYGGVLEGVHRKWRDRHPAFVSPPNLLANGSFERDAGGDDALGFRGWTVTGTRVVTLGTEGVTDGAFAVVFADGTPQSTPPTAHGATLAQSVRTEPGAEYKLTYDFAAFGSGAAEHVQSIRVEVTGASGERLAAEEITATGAIPPVFETRVLGFKADGESITVSFADATNNGETGRTDGVLDNVVLAPAAAPPTSAPPPPAAPTALDDPSEEQLRQILYAADAPVAVTPNWAVGYYLYDAPVNDRVVTLRNAVGEWLANTAQAPPRAHVLADLPVPCEPRVLVRGNPARLGPAVHRQFLSALSGDGRRPFTQGSGRLELARAVADRDNPLTARVFVNRVWAHHFGRGLVHTPSDFGARGEPPTHPELLDHLAWRFVADGWSVKKLHRLIMLSAAYRQASDGRADGRRLDPENRLLWRTNPQRLDFESLRDSMLAVAGRLDPTAGGPPADLAGPDATRRTVYGLVDRQNLPGMFATFDFPSPDAHSPARFTTTVPQQALFLMNSPFVVAQAGALAARAEVQQAAEPRARVDVIYRLALSRPPTDRETAAAVEFVGGGGTWEEFAQALLLSNEFAFVY